MCKFWFLLCRRYQKHFHQLYCDTVKFDLLLADAILDPGALATIQKLSRNTTPVPRSKYFWAVMHMDIVFGPEIAIGNIHYGLLLTD